MEDIPIVSLIILIPIIAAFAVMFVSSDDDSIRNTSLVATGISLMLSLYLWYVFDKFDSGYQFIDHINLIPSLNIGYKVGVDGISLPFLLLVTFTSFIVVVASWNIKHRLRQYMISFLILESIMITAFTSLDIVLFYMMFELVLIPMFLIIGIWGGKDRYYAAFKLFIYTFAASALMLIAIIFMVYKVGSADIRDLYNFLFDSQTQKYLWIAFFLAFAVKIPMIPFHTWLPDAHVQAPTAGSMILAGVLLKFGAYGFVRYSLPVTPIASLEFAYVVHVLSIIAIIYGSLVAFAQTDMKKMIAYSSIAHMGFITSGIFSFNAKGVSGAIFQSLGHGVASAGLFFIIGVLYSRTKTREISQYGGTTDTMPRLSVFFVLMMMSSIGFPGTMGFVGEFVILTGIFYESRIVALFVASGILLGAMYMLVLYRDVMQGELKGVSTALKDITHHEIFVLSSLGFVIIMFGVYPIPILDMIYNSSQILVEHFNNSILIQDTISN